MARAYSLDLRRRVVDAIEGGLSTREAARRFAIGIATAGAGAGSGGGRGMYGPAVRVSPRAPSSIRMRTLSSASSKM